MDNELSIDMEFLQEAVARFPEDESLADVFVKAMVDISTKLGKLTMNDNYKPHVNVSSSWCSHPFAILLTSFAGSQTVLQIPSFVECTRKAPRISHGTVCARH